MTPGRATTLTSGSASASTPSGLELHRCLVVREFQVLVLGHIHQGATFGRRPIEEFAEAFICPVVLVGPERPDQFRLNSPARLIVEKLGLESANLGAARALLARR